MNEGLPAREIDVEIGKRLREFREHLKIPRTTFAVEIGIGPQRLASYEAARVPLRYEVFLKMTRRFFLNPFWLAKGESSAQLDGPFDDEPYRESLRPRMLFTEAMEAILDKGTSSEFEEIQRLTVIQRVVNDLMATFPHSQESMPWRRKVQETRKLLSEAVAKMDRELGRNLSRPEISSKKK